MLRLVPIDIITKHSKSEKRKKKNIKKLIDFLVFAVFCAHKDLSLVAQKPNRLLKSCAMRKIILRSRSLHSHKQYMMILFFFYLLSCCCCCSLIRISMSLHWVGWQYDRVVDLFSDWLLNVSYFHQFFSFPSFFSCNASNIQKNWWNDSKGRTESLRLRMQLLFVSL